MFSSIQADPSLVDKQPNWQDLVQQQWQALFDRAAHLDLPQEVPSHLLCPLTMEVRHMGRGCLASCSSSAAGRHTAGHVPEWSDALRSHAPALVIYLA